MALGFQYIGGFAPCPLCYMERYAYYFAIITCITAMFLPENVAKLTFAACALAFAANAVLAGYHAGIEWGWWSGPDSCAGAGQDIVADAGNFLANLQTTEIARCDKAPLRIFGISFAGYNAILSAALAIFTLLAVSGKLNRSG
jgi:disulfide bond formation protein DsbB